ncbi:MAG: hypothetical protein KatS3mg110_2881 [Pirellulaceae bacterium]|nr:MAG: hypothetical protein KatS3mg110_2881 [Pirellulaceae bacterium]
MLGEEITDPGEFAALVDAIEAGLNNRLAELTCKIRYEVWRGEAASRQDALDGRFVQPLVLVEEGLYVKDRRLVRQQIRCLDPNKPNIQVEASESADAAKGLRLYWYVARTKYIDPPPGQGAKTSRAYADKEIVDVSDLEKIGGKTVPQELNPGILGPGSDGMGYPLCAEAYGRNPVSWVKAIISTPGTRVIEQKAARDQGVLTLHWKFVSQQFEITESFSYDMTKSYPLPTHSVVRNRALTGGRPPELAQPEFEVFYQDYERVPKGYLPKQVLMISRPIRGRPLDYCSVKIWKMVESSQSAPRDSDFDVKLPADKHNFTCLRKERVPPVVDGYRTYNLTRLNVSDLEPRCGGNPLAGRIRRRGHRWPWLWIAAAIGAAGAAVAGWRIWRRRNKQT